MAGARCFDEAAAQRCADDVLQSVCRSARSVPLDSLLLGDGDPLLMMRDWMREALARGSALRVWVGKDVWHQQHEQAWREIPPKIGQHVASKFAANPWFHSLPTR